MNVLITGITGFVGKNLSQKLSERGDKIWGTIRSSSGKSVKDLNSVQLIPVTNIDGETDWPNTLNQIDTIVHLAARVHVMADSDDDPLATYRQINVAGTIHLAKEAAIQGVKRFVYISSIKVNGEERPKAYTEEDIPAPQDPYGMSKWEAEKSLAKVAAETGLEVVIIRPPLVYGPGVKANFLRLLNLVQQNIPLPFGSLNNRRSMIFIGNLVSAIISCCDHPAAVNQTFLVSDNKDISVTELLRKMVAILQRKTFLLPIPPVLLNMAAFCFGKSAEARRLTKPLLVDCQKIRHTLSWSPPYNLEEGLRSTAKWFTKV